MLAVSALSVHAQRQMETLDRGLVAVKTASGVFTSWRIDGTEYYDTQYNLYRDGTRVNQEPLEVSNFTDPAGTESSTYTVRAVVRGEEQEACEPAKVWNRQYLEVPMGKVYSRRGTDITKDYSLNDATAADLDGDGEYELIVKRLDDLIEAFREKAELYRDTPTMAFTHIQPAEVTTIGYRLSQTIQDLNEDRKDAASFAADIKGKGMKGAVGTAASYGELLQGTGLSAMELEKMVMDELGIKAFDAATQTYTRKQDLKMISILSSIAATLHRFSLDFRVLQSPPIGEFSEPFGKMQVGSSAMPFKRNPINSEKICSLSRIVEESYQAAWSNASLSILERTLDDSADRRIFIPEAFIALDEMLLTETKIIKGMQVHSAATKRLMDNYGIFASTEKLLMELGKHGADRQEMHEVIREESLRAWALVQEGKENPLKESLSEDKRIRSYLGKEEILKLLDASTYTGDASLRTDMVLNQIIKSPALKSAK